MRHYLIAYDILSSKRAYRVRNLVYEYSMGGDNAIKLSQKALEL